MDLLIHLGGRAAALLALGAVVRGAWRVNRRVVTIIDAVQELSPNSGHSIKDQVTSTARDMAEMKECAPCVSQTDMQGAFRHAWGCSP
ncbi:hypothetical protein [Streptomyces dysideae]|uniref:Uncharacterized protein n=1 Tax=Streptomyces dysideae TaxID=909626 RepID=A0A101V1C2_9ACTN|nr:hypothetical protein [Streptomyces dysideae]KUO20682.1 hypothetical protein AQJ91_12180 [Streptomyces dysideae]